MTALPRGKHATTALHVVRPSFKFNNTGSTGGFGTPPGLSNGGDGGDWAYIPNGFFAMDVTPSLRAGLALNVPFGLTTNFDAAWQGQLIALKSAIKTINVQPSIAYKVNDVFSIGAGVSFQKIDAELTNSAGAAGVATLKASDKGWGFNVGATFQPSKSTRVGVHYRSAINYDLKGTVAFSSPAANAANSVAASASLKTPNSASLSVLHAANPRWDVMADLTWTGWSNLQRLDVIRASSSAVPFVLPANPLGGAAGTTFSTLQFEWDDTWRVGLGANYKMNDRTKIRMGLAYDKTPTNDLHRSPRLPDQDRIWVAFGVQYKPFKQGTLDIGYAHEFVKDGSVNNTVTGVPGRLVGHFSSKADIISVQYSHTF